MASSPHSNPDDHIQVVFYPDVQDLRDRITELEEQLGARQRVIDRFLEWDALTVLPDPLPAPFADLHYFLGEFRRVESSEHAARYGRSNPASRPETPEGEELRYGNQWRDENGAIYQ